MYNSFSATQQGSTRPSMKWFVIVALVLGFAVSAQSTDNSTLYGFGQCIDGKRTLYYYSNDIESCQNASNANIFHPPVHDLDCNVRCKPGYFLGANLTGQVSVSGCEKCNVGTYSLGGGEIYSTATGAWKASLSPEMYTECVTKDMFSGEWVSNCNPWLACDGNHCIESGSNTNIATRYGASRLYSIFRLSKTFVRPGSVAFIYNVDAEDPFDGLSFLVDMTTVLSLESRSNGWKEVIIPVSIGSHTLTWQYTKDYSKDYGSDRAQIKLIEITGTSFSDLYCYRCSEDISSRRKQDCAFCLENQYADFSSTSSTAFPNGTCQMCPINTYSPSGSIGAQSCAPVRPCTKNDIEITITDCYQNNRNITFNWAEPVTCNRTMNGSVDLPEDKLITECAQCDKGYTLDKGVCSYVLTYNSQYKIIVRKLKIELTACNYWLCTLLAFMVYTLKLETRLERDYRCLNTKHQN